MTRSDFLVVAILAMMLVGGFSAWVWLGGLRESNKWPVPPDAIQFLDWMVKGTSGSLTTILAQIFRRQSPTARN